MAFIMHAFRFTIMAGWVLIIESSIRFLIIDKSAFPSFSCKGHQENYAGPAGAVLSFWEASSEFRTELHTSATPPDIIRRQRAAHSSRQPCARLMAKGSMLGEVLAAASKSPPTPGPPWQK